MNGSPVRLRTVALAAIAALLPPGDREAEAAWLRAQADAALADCTLPEALQRCIADPAPEDEPLLRLAGELGMTAVEILATALAAAVETDLMCGRAIAHAQAPVGGSRPSLGLLVSVFEPFAEDGPVITAILSGAAIASGLLQPGSEGAPAAERAVSVPLPIALALEGNNAESHNLKWPGAAQGTDALREVALPPSVVSTAKQHASGLAGRAEQALVLRSGSQAEARAVAAEIAAALGLQPLFIDLDQPKPPLAGLVPWLLLRSLLPVFLVQPAPGERKSLPPLSGYTGPRLALCGREGSIASGGETVPGWTIGIASRDERTQLWETAVEDPEFARQLAAHRHSSGHIAQLGRLAQRRSRLEGRNRIEPSDVAAASWTSEGIGLESLAEPLPERIPDESLVLSPALRDELERLLLRCRSREGLTDGLGASALARYRPGVRALFSGPSGTGKTLAAGWLATRLGLPLYRVDLAAVTSKYIGETEKNLAQVMARAEDAEVILLFDEADSLFGKRTDVKEANDRFANGQTNYLLQRIESFEGIVLLTSNSRARFDQAFFRRLDAIVEFPVPGPAERRSLWQSHLGAGHDLSPRELNQLASAADLLGGNIRNAVLTAAVLARADARPIAFEHVLEAMTDEFRKLGKQLPAELRPGSA